MAHIGKRMPIFRAMQTKLDKLNDIARNPAGIRVIHQQRNQYEHDRLTMLPICYTAVRVNRLMAV